MKINLHLGFTGNCDAAFAFYETVFQHQAANDHEVG